MSVPERREHVLVCDLDESLMRINTFPRFAPFALRQLLLSRRWSDARSLARAGAKRRLRQLSHRQFKAELVRVSDGIPQNKLRDWARKIGQHHLNDEVAAVVADWPGLRILSTAAPQIYARALSELVGFDHVHGSVYTDDGFQDNVGWAKVRRLSVLVELPVDLVITDDEDADGPLISVARKHRIVRQGSGMSGPLGRPESV